MSQHHTLSGSWPLPLMVTVVLVLVLGFGLPLSSAQAFSSPNVSVSDPVYRDIDKLVAFGLVRDAIYGHRPWSRHEIARLIEEAAKHYEARGGLVTPADEEISERLAIEAILARLKKDYREELIDRGAIKGDKKTIRYRLLERASFELLLLDSPPRAVPQNNGVGVIDAFVNPLVEYREGLDYADGENFGFETSHYGRFSRYFSAYFRPHFRILVPNDDTADVDFVVQNLYGKFKLFNVELQVGRDHLIWGQGAHGGLFFTDNARALDMIKLANDAPFRYPWIFKYLGPSKITFFVANLGPERAIENAFLYGIKSTIKPASWVELGLSHTIMMGGEGAPGVDFWDPITEFFPVHKIGRNVGFEDVANHLFGLFEARFMIPPWRGLTLYYESFFDDSPLRAVGNLSDLWDQMSLIVGVYFPRLFTDGSVDLRFEYRHHPGWAYRHGRWTSGYTLNRELIGDPLGPDADAFYLTGRIDVAERARLELQFSYQDRDSDRFAQTPNASGGSERVFRAQDNPAEQRYQFQARLDWQFKPWLLLQPQFGVERVSNDNFSRGDSRVNFLGGARVIVTPHL